MIMLNLENFELLKNYIKQLWNLTKNNNNKSEGMIVHEGELNSLGIWNLLF